MTNNETLWQEISVAALLGTQRRPFESAPAGGRLGDLLAQVQPGGETGQPGGEDVLLRAAAVTSLYQRAGRLPAQHAAAAPPPCPPDSRPRCSQCSGSYLEQILLHRPALLQEWIELAAAHGVRVREEHLPALFEQQKTLSGLRQTILPVLGERGRWLAAQNPDWRAFVSYSDEQVWHEGQRKERLAYLADLRARDPNRARDLLASTWAQEAAAERAAFLAVLEDGVSMADEPFLESALDDRRKDVRQAAASLLARLPESRLVARMTARARRLLAWKSGLLRSSLEVTPPESCDAAMVRDGVEQKPPGGSKMGEKAWWLVQILSFVPPSVLAASWNKRPGQIMDVIRKHEWEDALLKGWSQAAERFGDFDWLEAVIACEVRRENLPGIYELFPKIPPAFQERLMIRLLSENPPLSYEQPASIYLSACRHSWSEEMTQAVITSICWTLQRGDMQPWRWEKLLRDIAPFVHPNLLGAACERIATTQNRRPSPDTSANTLLAALQFRLEMRQSFSSENSPKEPQ